VLVANKRSMKYIIYIAIAVAFIAGILWVAEKRTDALMAVGECVERKVNEDGFSGPVDQAWDTYAEQCVKEQ
jgi:hypothetical protein